jgi:hypothetical protein
LVSETGAASKRRFAQETGGEIAESVPQFRFRLLDQEVNDLGPLATKRDAWQPGERLSRWHGDELEVVRVVYAEAHEPIHGFLVVKRV